VAALCRPAGLRATHDYGALKECDMSSVCVPTPLNKNHDPTSPTSSRAGGIRAQMHPGQLILPESTTYRGRPQEDLLPVLKRAAQGGTGLLPLLLPERVDPGSKKVEHRRNTPKVVAG